ncbi:MAG TPA: alpha/beta hydrolase [Symbiobacteriaceae bacterium]|nr:alpha/beta hydrolase [Symbiobacteriaceae bacterium]
MPLVQLSNGMELFYREAGAGERTLLLLHGNTASSLWWERVIPHLPSGWRILAPDLRGCGDSTKPAGEWTMSDLAQDVALFLGAMELDQAVIVGHSLAGGIALQVAAEYPALVERLVLINSAPIDGLRLGPEAYVEVPEAVLRYALGLMMPTAPKDEFYERLVEESVTKSGPARIRHGRALYEMDLSGVASSLRQPTLVLWGAQDPLVTRAMMERMAAALPNAVLEVWEDVGHSAPVEAPERLATRIVEFCGV